MLLPLARSGSPSLGPFQVPPLLPAHLHPLDRSQEVEVLLEWTWTSSPGPYPTPATCTSNCYLLHFSMLDVTAQDHLNTTLHKPTYTSLYRPAATGCRNRNLDLVYLVRRCQNRRAFRMMAREAMKKGNTTDVSLISFNPYRMAKQIICTKVYRCTRFIGSFWMYLYCG